MARKKKSKRVRKRAKRVFNKNRRREQRRTLEGLLVGESEILRNKYHRAEKTAHMIQEKMDEQVEERNSK